MSTPSPGRDDQTTSGSLEPHPDQLAEIDRLHEVASARPTEIEPQIDLWRAVTALENWVVINRGTPEAPRPYVLAAPTGNMLAIYTSATRAKEGAIANGLIAEGDQVPLMLVPLPAGLDWALSFGQHGVAGVTVDYPRIGSWCPLPNLTRLRDERAAGPR